MAESVATPDTAAVEDASVWSIVRSPAFVLVSAVTFVQFFARTGALFNVVPLLGRERLGLSTSQIGLTLTLVSVLNVATLYHSGVLSDRFGRKPVIWPSTGDQRPQLGGVRVQRWVRRLSGKRAAVGDRVSGVSGPSPGAYIADLAPPSRRGRIFGLYRTCSDAGYIVGPLLLGWLVSLVGYSTPLLLTAAMFLAAGGLFALFAPEERTRTWAEPARADGGGGPSPTTRIAPDVTQHLISSARADITLDRMRARSYGGDIRAA